MGKPKPGKNMQFDPIEMIEKSAEMNRIAQTNPYGTSEYRTNPETGKTEFITEFNPELEDLHGRQMEMVKEGSIRDPLAHLSEQGGGGVGNLMKSMFGRMSGRYSSGSGGKPDQPDTAPDTLPMSTATQVREAQEREKLARIQAGTDQKAPYYPQGRT